KESSSAADPLPDRPFAVTQESAERSASAGASSSDFEHETRNSERQRAADEPGAADQQLHHLLAHSPAVLYVLNIERDKVVPILVSENIERLLGVTVAKSMT